MWFIGDRTLTDVFNTFQATINEIEEDKKRAKVKPYLLEYYNIKKFTRADPNDLVVTRVFNSLVDAINERKRFPRFLIVILDKDVINNADVFDDNILDFIRDSVNWLVKQIALFLKRKKIDILAKRPGAIYGDDPTVIFVRMIRRICQFKRGSRKDQLFSL